jgi:hypothetical protein
LRTTQCYARRC